MNSPTATPGVIFWFKVYCWILCVIHLLVIAMAISLFFVEPEKLETPVSFAYIMGTIMLVYGATFFVLGLLPLIIQHRPWLRVFDLIVICVGLTNCCFWPICIPLLIFWCKPEVKQYFGKS